MTATLGVVVRTPAPLTPPRELPIEIGTWVSWFGTTGSGGGDRDDHTRNTSGQIDT